MNTLRKFATAFLTMLGLLLGVTSIAQAQVTVTAADPSSAIQGTTSLDVTVSGSGFDSSAQVNFLVTGTSDPGGITVRKVSVRGSKKLVATIDVADTAVVDEFDIEVVLSNGRKGKGTTLFTVQLKPNQDPCATPGLDFPAFIYWRPNGPDKQIYVTDADGICSRPLITTAGARGAKFSFPVDQTTNRGRVAYVDMGIWAVDFEVVGTAITVSSPRLIRGPYSYLLELSADGQTVYFNELPGSPTGAERIRSVAIDGSNLRDLYQGPSDGTSASELAVSTGDETLYADNAGGASGYRKLLQIGPGCANANCTTQLAEDVLWHALSDDGSTLVYSRNIPGYTSCYVLTYFDTGSQVEVLGGSQPRYGTASSWLGDKVLTNGLKAPDRKGYCRPVDMITRIDPATGQETPLLSGYDPDGR